MLRCHLHYPKNKTQRFIYTSCALIHEPPATTTTPPLRRRRPLEVIHELLLSFAEAGANVLRLKGGGFLGPAFFLTQLSHINSPAMVVLCMACSQDGPPNERKIVKLCEYAAKNPFRIPKIAKYREDRCYKELRLEHIKFINIVAEAYNRLLFLYKEHMAYFAVSLLNVVTELLDNLKQDPLRILGCQTLTRFIYS
ncbi:unnamed protein product [Prunus armeniaca]